MGQRWEKTGGNDPKLWRQIVWGHYATTSVADYNIGRVLDALDASGPAENAIVGLVSDNGYHLGEKNHFEKSTRWSASARIPFVVRLPGSKNGGSENSATVGLIDLFPTMLDYGELPNPRQRVEGLSLRGIWEDPSWGWRRPGITFYEENQFSVTDGRFRYIRYCDGSEELYEFIPDPHEFTNRADDPVLAEEKVRLKQWMPERWAPSLGGREG